MVESIPIPGTSTTYLTVADSDEAWERARGIADSAERLVERWADKPGTGISRGDGGDYEVDIAEFEQFMGKQANRDATTGVTDVNNVTLEQGRDLDMGHEL